MPYSSVKKSKLSVCVVVAGSLLLTACGETTPLWDGSAANPQDQEALSDASDLALQYAGASPAERCRFEADNVEEAADRQCREDRSLDVSQDDAGQEWEVRATEPWGIGFAVQVKASNIMVIGLQRIDNEWKVFEAEAVEEHLPTQPGWACEVIGGPDCDK